MTGTGAGAWPGAKAGAGAWTMASVEAGMWFWQDCDRSWDWTVIGDGAWE